MGRRDNERNWIREASIVGRAPAKESRERGHRDVCVQVVCMSRGKCMGRQYRNGPKLDRNVDDGIGI